MFDWLAKLVRRPSMQDPPEMPVSQIAIAPADRDISRLAPVILASTVNEVGWPGPLVGLGDLPFSVVFAVCGPMNTFVYVTHEQAGYWEDAGIDWRRRAFENLARITGTRPASGEKRDLAGRPLVQVMLHDDAIGPSRLLLPDLFRDVFGGDYAVALPEQTCAIAYRLNLSVEEAADVDRMIEGCFVGGTEPMSRDRFQPSAFWGPAQACGFAPNKPLGNQPDAR